MTSYFVIHASEDGTSITAYTKEDLESRLDEEYWGDVQILSGLPSDSPDYWGNSILIIEGNVRVPTAKKVVTKHKL